jgi:hypothetical protein
MAKKFIRGLQYTGTTGREACVVLKFLYEFWGYCVNGGASLSSPGGLASTTPTNLPTNCIEGTSVLASGSDGATTAGSGAITFTAASAPFTASMVGKYITIWKAGSGSSEDSIYIIIGFNSTSSILINSATGGTPDVSSLHPSMTARTSIKYRVFDPVTASATGLAFAAGQYIVFQTNASTVNTGQANSQFQFLLRDTNYRGVTVVLSPEGTWTGAAFTDGTPAVAGLSQADLFTNSNAITNAYIFAVADVDVLLVHVRDSATLGANGSAIHVEVPLRMYPQANDTNPFTAMIDCNVGLSSVANNYGGGFRMVGYDNTTRYCKTLVKTLSGDGNCAVGVAMPPGTFGGALVDQRLIFNGPRQKILMSDGLVAMIGTSGQFYLARAKLRNAKFINASVPAYHRVGNSGEWLHFMNGICWPWDNTILPFNPGP